MTKQTEYSDWVIKERAKHSAEKKMPIGWDRRSITLLTVYYTYYCEALMAEYNALIGQAHAHGYIAGIMGKLTITQSLNTFFEEIK